MPVILNSVLISVPGLFCICSMPPIRNLSSYGQPRDLADIVLNIQIHKVCFEFDLSGVFYYISFFFMESMLYIVSFSSRSDVPSYKVFRDGSHFETVNDLKKFSWRKMVTFYLGCSFSFDDKLTRSGIKLETTENVSMYLSNVKCHKVAKFQTKMVVSMRPIPKSLIQEVYEATMNLEYCHGAPVHFGYPKNIGVDVQKDIDFGSKVDIPKGCVPVFWACGVTSSEAVKNASKKFSYLKIILKRKIE